MKEANKVSTYTLTVPSEEKGGSERVMRIHGCREENNMQKHIGLQTKMKEAEKGSTYTLSVPSQEKGG